MAMWLPQQHIIMLAGRLLQCLTHWGRVTHICVSKFTIIGSDNGLSPGRRQAIIWTNAGILLTGHLGTKFSEILIKIYTFSFKKMHMKISSGKWRPFCLGLNVLTEIYLIYYHFLTHAIMPILSMAWKTNQTVATRDINIVNGSNHITTRWPSWWKS